MTGTEIIATVWNETSPDSDHFTASLNRKTGLFLEYKWGPKTARPGPLSEELELLSEVDLYWAPGGFRGRRTNENLSRFNLLWADLDGFDEGRLLGKLDETGFEWPDFAWMTSPDNMQALWRIKELGSYEEWASYNKALTYALGADKGGWHGSKLLRIPGTQNWKRGGVYGFTIAKEFRQPLDVKIYLTPADTTPIAKTGDRLIVVPGREQWEAAVSKTTDAEYSVIMARARDRSAEIWNRSRLLKGAGYSQEDIFTLLWFSPCNKWQTNPAKLMADIVKATS